MTDAVERQDDERFERLVNSVTDDLCALLGRERVPTDSIQMLMHAAKQRIAELEGELDEAKSTAWDILVKEKAEARRTGFLECQRQAVECARHQAFDTTRSANWDTPQSACEAIAQAISLLQPTEGDNAAD